MLLQEMKHRIKNYLTRVLAISNQTARVSADLDQYSAAFNSRIHAMSASQDLLTRSPEETALLRELLVGELRSIFADRDSRYRLEGEKIRLNAQQTQSLGLTFHELATNALKYGGLAKEGNSLLVTWRSENREDEPYLVIDWIERGKTASTETPKGGFGSRLIQLSIVTELEGSFDQKFENGGYHATITIPLRDETSD
jgi:two-component sensor histidine kinase